MPQMDDVDYQRGLDSLSKQARAKGILYWRGSVLLSALLLFGFPIILGQFNLDSVLRISLMIAAATLCLIMVINSGINHLHGSLTIVAGTIEWWGRKQLGEYESQAARQ